STIRILRPLRSTPFPYTTLFRSLDELKRADEIVQPVVASLIHPFDAAVAPVQLDAFSTRHHAPAQPFLGVRPIPGHASGQQAQQDRKSTRLNSSHGSISYAVFCL